MKINLFCFFVDIEYNLQYDFIDFGIWGYFEQDGRGKNLVC